MRSIRFAFAASLLAASTAFASPTAPVNGADYITLAAPQPSTTVGKKVEVIEFFMFHCPHCNALEPTLHDWVVKQGQNINFKRVHMLATGPGDPETHLFLTLEAMNKLDEYVPKVFKAIHVERQRLNSDAAMIDWAAKNGLDRAKFLEYWNSFGVLSKLKRNDVVQRNYKVESVPTLIIDGRFVTSPGMVSDANKSLPHTAVGQAVTQVLSALVANVQKEKGGK